MEKCPTPDASKLKASRGTTATGGMLITGKKDSVKGAAKVVAEDKDGNRSEAVSADNNGEFSITEIALPSGFDHKIGNKLKITQRTDDCDESDPAEVEIER